MRANKPANQNFQRLREARQHNPMSKLEAPAPSALQDSPVLEDFFARQSQGKLATLRKPWGW